LSSKRTDGFDNVQDTSPTRRTVIRHVSKTPRGWTSRHRTEVYDPAHGASNVEVG
jgi:hypothetical protein